MTARKPVLKRLLLLVAVLTFALIGSVVYNNQRIISLFDKVSKLEEKHGGPKRAVWDEKAAIEKVKHSVVRIFGGESEGSGFAIKEGGYILTNFHVIQFEPSPKIILPDNTFETGQIIMGDKDADLAVIKIGKNLPSLPLANLKELTPAEDLLAIGFPLGGYLPGESSVIKGHFSARRYSKRTGMDYLQTDMTLVGGMSGGPMVNIFGEVVGVSTMGLYGMGMAVSADTIRNKWAEMAKSKEALKDVRRIVFEPNKSPLEAVRCFYNYLKIRNLPKAFELLSDNFVRGYSFEHWAKGYEPLLDTTVLMIWPNKTIDNRIHVKLGTTDFVDGEIVYKLFQGYWDVRQIDGRWLLWHPRIRQVEDPGEDWLTKEEDGPESAAS